MNIHFLPLFAAVWLALSASSLAQTTVKQYYTALDQAVTDSAEAAYYKTGVTRMLKGGREVFTDSVHTYYHPSGKLKGREFYSADGEPTGAYVYYFENGNRMEEGTYRGLVHVGNRKNWYPNGQMHRVVEHPNTNGEVSDEPMIDYKLVAYWDSTGAVLVEAGNGYCRCTGGEGPEREMLLLGNVREGLRDSVWEGWKNGEIQFREKYKMHRLAGGVSFLNGQEVAYTKFHEMAEYRTGLTGLANFLKTNVKYPRAARKARLQGSVYVAFVVGTDGALYDVMRVGEALPLLDDEAVRAVMAMPRWRPGKHRGILVKSRFVLPIKFKLAG